MPALIGKARAKKIGAIARDSIPVFIAEDTLDDILSYSAKDLKREVGGFLIGNFCEDHHQFISIDEFLPAADASSKAGSITFTHQTWDNIHEQMEQSFPNRRIVGWHHTHPAMGIFLSNYDKFIHQNFFSQPWQVAIVVDPCQKQFGVFQWRKRELINNGFCIVPSQKRGRHPQRRFKYG
jgi:proteasome lid subunit RPN8/RPN11